MLIGIFGTGLGGQLLVECFLLVALQLEMWSAIPMILNNYKVVRVIKFCQDVNVQTGIQYTECLRSVCIKKDILVFGCPSVY